MAYCVALVLPVEVRPKLQNNLRVLPDRIGRNGEIAGLHYRSDTVAGITLANNIFTVLSAEDADSKATMRRFLVGGRHDQQRRGEVGGERAYGGRTGVC